MLVVDPWDWLEKDGSLPVQDSRLRRRVLRIARFVEYGGPLGRGEVQRTLIECARRPAGKPCTGLLWVQKTEDDGLLVMCPECGVHEAFIHNWQGTPWATGIAEPLPAVRTVPPTAN